MWLKWLSSLEELSRALTLANFSARPARSTISERAFFPAGAATTRLVWIP
jgi:hypothetical protein